MVVSVLEKRPIVLIFVFTVLLYCSMEFEHRQRPGAYTELMIDEGVSMGL